MTFLTTQPGWVGDVARMSGYAVVSLVKKSWQLEERFAVLRKAGDVLYDTLEVGRWVGGWVGGWVGMRWFLS